VIIRFSHRRSSILGCDIFVHAQMRPRTRQDEAAGRDRQPLGMI